MDARYHKRTALRRRDDGGSLREIVKEAGAPNHTFRENLRTVKRWLGED
jgi:hypothetical protein